MTEQARIVIEVFYAYANKNKYLQQRLESHLSNLKQLNAITSWSRREIGAGIEWEQVTYTHLNTAQIILLLISPDFMASDYRYGKEMKRALERHERKEARVIPVILRPIDLEGATIGALRKRYHRWTTCCYLEKS